MSRPARAEEDAAQVILGDDFQDAICLWTGEVEVVARSHAEEHKDDQIQKNNEVLHQTLTYVQRFSNFRNKEAMAAAREVSKKYEEQFGLHSFEIACLNNLDIDTADEARTLIPSLAAKFPNEEDLEKLLEELRRYRVA